MNWLWVNRPKKLGGLGILDLNFFNRALQLRWLWFNWTDSDKPWSGIRIPTACTQLDEDLFRACTFVTVGDGKKTCFWKDRWLLGQAPKDIAPLCFRLAWRKNQTVATSLPQNNWMKGLKRLLTQAEIRQFVDLWIQLQTVQLQPQDDQIHWRFTPDGKYSSKSAYEAQFLGAHPDYRWMCVWKEKVENKSKFFLWLLLQHKLMTADRIIKRGGQTNPICQLCRTRNESMPHMVANCSYSKTVWNHVSQLTTPPHLTASAAVTNLKTWWTGLNGSTAAPHQWRGPRFSSIACGTFGKSAADGYMITRRSRRRNWQR